MANAQRKGRTQGADLPALPGPPYLGCMSPALPAAVLEVLRRKDTTTRIAVIGASSDRSKFGNRIVRDLAAQGYAVVPVHPRETRVEGLEAVARVGDVAGPVAIANFVVPPAVGLDVLAALDPAQVACVWFQPGAYDAALVAAARARFAQVVVGDCIMVVARGV